MLEKDRLNIAYVIPVSDNNINVRQTSYLTRQHVQSVKIFMLLPVTSLAIRPHYY